MAELTEDKLHDECAVFGCVVATASTDFELSSSIAMGLTGLQHRGQESTGIVTGGKNSFSPLNQIKGMGLVSQVYNSENLGRLTGVAGIGHNRYSTSGKSELSNCQPFIVNMQYGAMAVAHNGELVNKKVLRKEILARGVGLSTSSDSELLTQIMCLPLDSENGQINIADRIKGLMKRSPTSYSMLVLHSGAVYAARDPYGNRPLCLGKVLDNAPSLTGDKNPSVEAYVVSSESCVFQSLGAALIRDVNPGEVVKIYSSGFTTMGSIVPRPDGSAYSAFCIFEYVYFSRMDSVYGSNTVYNARRDSGIMLAIEAPVQADFVSTVPNSAPPAAIGFSRQSGIKYEDVLAKNSYIGRTFIKPTQRLRKLAVEQKFGVIRDNVRGKRIVLVDDSIVRGTTMQCIIKMLRKGGATEVHVRIASPPVRSPCYMGINIPTSDELLANNTHADDIAGFLNADSVQYLSLKGLLHAVRGPAHEDGLAGENGVSKLKVGKTSKKVGHCTACLTKNYPVKLEW